MFEKDAPRLSCPCGHEGSNFTKINLSVNVAGITVEGENGIVTEKMLALFLCPVCGTVKALLPSHLNTNSIGVPADEPRSENSAGAVSSPPSFDERNIDLFFMIDTSGSMEGSSIGSVNSVFEELMLELKRIVEDNPGLHIKTAALEFSSGARWITRDGPVPVEQFQWKPIEADGVTDVGEAFKLLDKTLSTETFPVDESGKAEIVLFLLTDGSPTDNWQNEFEKLKRNNWFKASRKFGVAIGDDADIDMLKEFTGSEESVVETFDAAWIVNKGILESRNRSSNRKDNHEDNTREDDDVW